MFNWLQQKIVTLVNKLMLIFGYRIIKIPLVIKGIGHHITEPCTLIKRQRLGLIPPNYKFIIFFSVDLTYSKFQKPHVNTHLIKYLKKYFVTCLFEYSDSKWEKFKFRLFAPFIYPETYGLKSKKKNSMIYQVSNYMSDTQSSAAMFETNRVYSKKLFEITKEDERYAKKILKKLNVPENEWFATFHYRDNVFYDSSSFWEKNYSNRCVDIETYFDACKEVVSKGGWCFRMAAKKSNPLPESFKTLEKVIDVSDIIDVGGDIERFSIFLLSKCRFFLGCNSGPSLAPGYFGVPVVQVQTAPFYGLPIHKFDIFTYKKYWHIKEKRYLSLNEMVLSPYCHTILDKDFKDLGIRVDSNTAAEISNAVNEMISREQKINPKYSELKSSKEKFGSPSLYCYKAASSPSKFFINSYEK